jgi:hypothetical protein
MVDEVVINGVEYRLSSSSNSSMAARHPLSHIGPNNEFPRHQVLREKRHFTAQYIPADVQLLSLPSPSTRRVLPKSSSSPTLLQPQVQTSGLDNKVAYSQHRPAKPSLPWCHGIDQRERLAGIASSVFPASAMYFISIVANMIPSLYFPGY